MPSREPVWGEDFGPREWAEVQVEQGARWAEWERHLLSDEEARNRRLLDDEERRMESVFERQRDPFGEVPDASVYREG